MEVEWKYFNSIKQKKTSESGFKEGKGQKILLVEEKEGQTLNLKDLWALKLEHLGKKQDLEEKKMNGSGIEVTEL